MAFRFADYRKRMEKAASAWMLGRKLLTSQAPFILKDHAQWPQNLLEPGLAGMIEAERARRATTGAGFPLHKYLHHGLSSQAMLFNLVLPLQQKGDIDALKGGFDAAGIPWPGPGAAARLEVEDRSLFNENSGQPTSFDLEISGPGGPSLYIEAKLVEQEFGGCSLLEGGDCDGENPAKDHQKCALVGLGRRYWERLDALGFDLSVGPICPFGSYYQFYREAAFALTAGGHYVLLVHDQNPAFWKDGGERGLWPLLLRSVPEQHRSRLHRLSLQQLAEALRQTGHHPWIDEFSTRYALNAPVLTGQSPEDVLALLPPPTAAAIRRLWEDAVKGGMEGRVAQARISKRLAGEGIFKGDPRWERVIGYGRRLYYGDGSGTI